MRKLVAHQKSDHGSMTSFERPFKRHEQIRQSFNQDEYGIKIKIFDDSSYFVYWNQPSIYDVYFDVYIDHFDQKFTIKPNVNLFKGYMYTKYVDEESLRFLIIYSRREIICQLMFIIQNLT